MNDGRDRAGRAAERRRQAEELAARGSAAGSPGGDAALPPEEERQTLHELHVHQIELELQNEELRRTQQELDVERARYFDLYQLAPVGYCTLSEPGLIVEANLTLATLLAAARGTLTGQPLTRFVLPDDQDVYYRHHKQLHETGLPQLCDLRLAKTDGSWFWAHLAATAALDARGAPACLLVVSDISGRKRAEARIENQLEELRRWQDVMLGREDRVQQLKREVNELCRRLGEAVRYPFQQDGPAGAP